MLNFMMINEQKGEAMFRIVPAVMLVWVGLIGQTAWAEAGGNSIEVVATDFRFTPARWTVDAGETVKLTLSNTSVQDHEWVLLKLGAAVTLPFDEDDEEKVFWEIEAGSGVTREETFTVPQKSGVYSIVCGKPRHIERGMTATLVIR